MHGMRGTTGGAYDVEFQSIQATGFIQLFICPVRRCCKGNDPKKHAPNAAGRWVQVMRLFLAITLNPKP